MSTSFDAALNTAASPSVAGSPTSRAAPAVPAASRERVRIEPDAERRAGPPRWLRRTAGPLLLLALWWLASAAGWLPAEILAGPQTVVAAAGQLWTSGELPEAIRVSLQRTLLGLALGGSVGVALAVVSGLFRLGEDLVDSPMQMLRTVPNVALIPLLIIWFGIGEAPKVALIALATAFPLYLNVYAGIRNVDQTLVEAGRTLELSRWALVRHVILPGALPNALVGLRYALGVSWLALVFGEQINATAGIGYLMNTAREMFQTEVIVVCLVVYALLGLAVDLVVRLLERLLLAWRPSFSGA
ncbi:MAG: ABC transporter permease subunit [Comamonas sp.]